MNPAKVVVLLEITACVGVILYVVYLVLFTPPMNRFSDPEEGEGD